MGKIFEALQHAQSERQQRDEIAQRHLDQFTKNVQALPDLIPPAIMKLTSCNCHQNGYRIRRQGTRDFLYRFIRLYPWRCSQCNSRFHRFQRA